MRTRNIRLFIILIILATGNMFLLLRDPGMSRLGFEPDLFSIADTTQIESIEINGPKGLIIIKRSDNWMVDSMHSADPNVLRLLFAVMNRVTVSRELGETELEQLSGSSFIKVSIDFSDVSKMSFDVTGDLNATKTFFFRDDNGYEVEIPGYRDYVGGIFQLDKDQWKDRLIFNGNWRTIQKLDFNYTAADKNDFMIAFAGQFFEIDGLNQIDSNAVVGYLDEFEFLQANERLSPGKFERFDSLSRTSPEIIITVEDIKYQDTQSIKLFPILDGDNVRLVLDTKNQLTVFDENRIRNLFRVKSDFVYQSQ